MQVMAQPDSLCGVSAVDQSVLIKEPGNTLNADKVTAGIIYKQLLTPFRFSVLCVILCTINIISHPQVIVLF